MNPFVFKLDVNAVIISYKADDKLKKIIENNNIDIIETLKCEDLDDPINDHPDMVIHPINYKNFVVYYKYYNYYYNKLNKYGINVIKSSNKLNKIYPNDIYLNVSRVGKYFFHKSGYIDKNLKTNLEKNFQGIEIKQGYAKCSTLILKDNVVVTTDLKLNKKYKELGLVSYLLPPNKINLPGYDTGFIGGTCGNIGKDKVVFYGNLEKYEFKKELIKILHKENISYIYPNTETFLDRGSIIGILGGK